MQVSVREVQSKVQHRVGAERHSSTGLLSAPGLVFDGGVRQLPRSICALHREQTTDRWYGLHDTARSLTPKYLQMMACLIFAPGEEDR